MESLVKSFFGDIIDIFCKNFDYKRDLSVNLSKAEAHLQNIYLNEDVIREILGFESLGIDRLQISGIIINVSPTKIMSVPTVVDVRSLDMVLRELPEPIPLPSKWSDFNKQQASKAEYGRTSKITDGICFRIERLSIVLVSQPVPDLVTGAMRNSPLSVLVLNDLRIEQTDNEWKVVDLKSARRFNRDDESQNIYRKASLTASAYIVAYSGSSDASHALLRGAQIESLLNGIPGIVSIFKGVPMVAHLLLRKKLSNSALLRSDIALYVHGILKVKLTPEQMATVLDLAVALQRVAIATAADLANSSLNLSTGTAAQQEAPRKKKKYAMKAASSRLANMAAFEGSAGLQAERPSTLLQVHIQRLQLEFIQPPTVAPGFSPLVAAALSDHAVRGVGIQLDRLHYSQLSASRYHKDRAELEELYQTQFDLLSLHAVALGTGAKDVRPIAMVAKSDEAISGFVPAIRALARADDHEIPYILRFSFSQTTPCPSPPMYGKEVQLRLRRIDINLHEECVDFLVAYFTAARMVQVAQPLSAKGSPAVSIDGSQGHRRRGSTASNASLPSSFTDGNTQTKQRSPSTASVASARSQQTFSPTRPASSPSGASQPSDERAPAFNTFQCYVDINGPTVRLYPRSFTSPLATVYLKKLILAGHRDLPQPTFALMTVEDAFPQAASDYVGDNVKAGNNLATTNLDLWTQPFSINFMSMMDSGEASSLSTVLLSQDLRVRPIVEFGEVRLGFKWDNTASPQLLVSAMIDDLRMSIPRSTLHFLFLLQKQYAAPKPFPLCLQHFFGLKREGDQDVSPLQTQPAEPSSFNWTSLLAFLPNPDDDGELETLSAFSVVSRLPTYAVGMLAKRIDILLLQESEASSSNEVEIAKIAVTSAGMSFEHHKVKDSEEHRLIVKMAVVDFELKTLVSGHALRRQDGDRPIFALRFEDTIGDAKGRSGNATAALLATIAGSDLTSEMMSEVQEAVSTHTPSEATRFTALNALFRLKEYFERKRVFRQNGLTVQLGHAQLYLNAELFVALAVYFLADITDDERARFDQLHLPEVEELDLGPDAPHLYVSHIAPSQEDKQEGGLSPDSASSQLASAATSMVTGASVEDVLTQLSMEEKALFMLTHLSSSIAILEDELNSLARTPMYGPPVAAGAPPSGFILRRDIESDQNRAAANNWHGAMEALNNLKAHRASLSVYFAARM